MRSITMGPIATDVSVVGRSVWNETFRYPAITAGPIEMPFGMWGGVGHSCLLYTSDAADE